MNKINLEILKTLELNKEYTYKELCDLKLFNIYFTGDCNGKKNQLEELAIYCKYSKLKKSRGKYIIKEIYTQKQIINQLSQSQLQNDIQLLLLDKLAKADGNNIIITTSALMGDCGMVNRNYFYKVEDIAYTLGIEEDIIADVLSLAYNTNRGYIARSLAGLKNEGLILLEYMLFVNLVEYDEYNEDGTPNKKGTFHLEARQATQEERNIYIEIQNETMEEMKIDSLKYLYKMKNSPLRLTFYKKLNSKLKEYDIYSSFFAYNITYSKRFVMKELGKRKAMELQSSLNKSILDSIYEKIETKSFDVEAVFLKELGEELMPLYEDVIEKEKAKQGVRGKENYVADGKQVAKTVISSKTRKQIKKVPKKKHSKKADLELVAHNIKNKTA